MNESSQRSWDVIIKAVTAAVGLFMGGLAVAQYKSESQNRVITQKIEREKLDLELHKLEMEESKQQLQLLDDTKRVVGILASSQNSTDISTALGRFWTLYWGDLIGVESQELEAAMVRLGRLLPSRAEALTSMNAGNRAAIQQAAIRIADLCEAQIKEIRGRHLLKG